VDAATLAARAVAFAGSGLGDAPVLPDLRGQMPEDSRIASVTASGACDTRGCRDTIANRDAHAFEHSFGHVAVMSSRPPLWNAKLWKKNSRHGAGTRNCAPSSPLDGSSCDGGAAIIAAVARRRR